MDVARYEPVLIGPIGAGKSTLGRLVAERLGLPQVAVDFLRFRYYKEIGYDADVAGRIREAGGFQGLLGHWKPFEAHGIERILAEHEGCVFDFGAGHSVQEDPRLFARLRAALAPFANVILLLPTPDDEESLRILAARREPLVAPGFNFDELCVRGPCNRALATTVVYTEGHSPEQTRDEIIAGLRGRAALVPAQTAAYANALAASADLALGREQDQDRAASALESALAIRRRLGDPGPVADALLSLSHLERVRQHGAAAQALAESALAQCRPVDAPRRSRALFAVAEVALARGDPAAAVLALDECLEIRRLLQRGRPIAETLLALARALGKLGETARAQGAAAEARRWFLALGSPGALRDLDRFARHLAAPAAGPLEALRNGVAVSADGEPAAADADGGGMSYSAQALAAAGAVPGGALVAAGVTFRWPEVPVGSPDNVEVDGQTVLLPARPGATGLALLGAATNGPAAGLATIHYSDGGSSTFELRFADWTLGGGQDQPAEGTEIAVRTAYRNGPSGQPDQSSPLLFVQRVTLDPARPVASVTLPAEPGPGTMHLFDVVLIG